MIDGRATASLRFEILGDVRVLRDGVPVDLGPAKQRAVLAVLLLQAGRPVPTHQIVDGVWGDDPPENGANVVQKYVAGLRRVLDPNRAPRTPGELLALTGGGYVLRTTGGSADADEFQAMVTRAAADRAAGRFADAAGALRSGLALWRGEALAGLTGPVFEAARARLAESHATVWESWAEIELERGQSVALIPDLTRLVEEFPLREGLRALLMTALHQAGRQAEALAAFRDAREYFLDEFGVEPGEKMQDAHRRILRGETRRETPAVTPAAPVSPSPAGAPPAAPPHSAPPHSAPPHSAPPHSAPPLPAAPHSAPRPDAYRPVPPAPAPAVPHPPRRRIPVGQVLLAALLPLLTVGLGAWIYFVVLGFRHNAKRQYIVAAAYAAIWIIGFFTTAAVDPTPPDSPDLSGAEVTGVTLLFLTAIASAFHGVVMATHMSLTSDHRKLALSEHARQVAAHDSALALQMGVGRPDLPRAFHGGLVDINHVEAAKLAKFTRLRRAEAHRVVADRIQRGPFLSPDDLVTRGLITRKRMQRIRPRLIAIPPVPQAGPAPWARPYS